MKKYQCYKNLHRNCWSIKDKATGLVVGHADSVMLFDCKWVVRQAGRKRVLETGQKNVHAWVEGEIVNASGFTPFKGRTVEYHGRYPAWDHDKLWLADVTYNPRKYSSFVVTRNGNPIKHTRSATLNHLGQVTGGFLA